MTEDIAKLVSVLEAAVKWRDSTLVRVRIDAIDEEGCRLVRHLGGQKTDGPRLRRLPQAALRAPTAPGPYLVRIIPLDPHDATTWDWHDWRECPS